MALYFQGAESKVYIKEYLGMTTLVKERFNKNYRNKQLNNFLILERMKAECRNIIRCKQAGIRTPTIYYVDWEKSTIYMEYFEGSKTVKQYLDDLQDSSESDQERHQLSVKIGENLAKMHKSGLTHGDLTSSNMLLVDGELIFIDFGLSTSNCSSEDKGVDLYVLEKALISSHANASKLFDEIMKTYKAKLGNGSKEILSKFDEIRLRGRKRLMVG